MQDTNTQKDTAKTKFKNKDRLHSAEFKDGIATLSDGTKYATLKTGWRKV